MSSSRFKPPFHLKSAPVMSLLGDGFLAACVRGDVHQVCRTLEKDAAVMDKPDAHGLTPLMWAAASGSSEVVRLLVGRGADVNAESLEGYTPLMAVAAYGRSVDDAKCLLAAGAKVNHQNKNGWTALMEACRYGNDMIALYLVQEAGADFTLVQAKGETAEDIACQSGRGTLFLVWLQEEKERRRQAAIEEDTRQIFEGINPTLALGGRLHLRPPRP